MFSPHKINSPLSSSFDESVFQNHRQIKNKQSKYFIDEYQKSINQKMEKQEEQKLRKKQQLEQYNQKNQQYLNAVLNNRYNKLQEKQYMAEQYDEMINQRKLKEQQEKKNEKSFERDLLGQKTWLRDMNQQRQINKMKVNRYNEQLEMHVKAQEQRIKQQQDLEKQMRQKINEQAQIILNKEIQELQDRQRRKNIFQQRQNELLGINQPLDNNSNYHSLSNSKVLQEISMRKRQQELYGAGLEAQRLTQEQRKRKQVEQAFMPGQSYNPITNPIPVVYKNPNVLRMLSQK